MAVFDPLRTLARACRIAEVEPDTFLEKGARLLAEKLEPLSYRFAIVQPPLKGSGGPFAWAAFKRDDREIQLWARYGQLGSVRYRLGDDELTHQEYMRAMGLETTAHWPGFDDGDPLGGFKRLLSDLGQCDDFLTGDAASVVEKVRALPPEKTGFQALGS
jgi:hypothetical protein